MHNFWSNQPIDIELYDDNNYNNIVSHQISYIDLKTTRQIPFDLPNKLSWYNIDLSDDELYIFLFTNYNESEDGNFRFIYTKKIINWYITQANNLDIICLGVKYNNNLVACIFGISTFTNIYGSIINQFEINFLCIKKDFRNNRLAPILIGEIARQIKFKNIYSAIYSSSLKLPNNIVTIHYYHKYINIKKLLDCKFMSTVNNEFQLNKNIYFTMQPLNIYDCTQCCKLLNKFLLKYNISRCFTINQFINHFMNNNIIKCYVIKKDGLITDFISWYVMDTLIINKNDLLSKGFMYYYFNNSIDLKLLVGYVINMMYYDNIDVIDCLNIMNYPDVFEDLGFVLGNGYINYYMYNWKCSKINSTDLAYFMV